MSLFWAAGLTLKRSAERTSHGLMPQDLPRITQRLQTPLLLSSQGERSNSPEYPVVRRIQIENVPAQPLVGGPTTVSTHLHRESVAFTSPCSVTMISRDLRLSSTRPNTTSKVTP